MNPELQKALVEFVAQSAALIKSGTDQIPAVLHEILLYGRITSGIWTVVLLGIAAVSGILAYRGLRLSFWLDTHTLKALDGRGSDLAGRLNAGSFVCGIGSVLVAPAALVWGVHCAFDFLQATVTPRLYILNWLRDWL